MCGCSPKNIEFTEKGDESLIVRQRGGVGWGYCHIIPPYIVAKFFFCDNEYQFNRGSDRVKERILCTCYTLEHELTNCVAITDFAGSARSNGSAPSPSLQIKHADGTGTSMFSQGYAWVDQEDIIINKASKFLPGSLTIMK
jgi:hypothetical protein